MMTLLKLSLAVAAVFGLTVDYAAAANGMEISGKAAAILTHKTLRGSADDRGGGDQQKPLAAIDVSNLAESVLDDGSEHPSSAVKTNENEVEDQPRRRLQFTPEQLAHVQALCGTDVGFTTYAGGAPDLDPATSKSTGPCPENDDGSGCCYDPITPTNTNPCYEFTGTVCHNGACIGNGACLRAGLNGGSVGVISESCDGDNACSNAGDGGIVGDITGRSCVGRYSCSLVGGFGGRIGTISEGSCDGPQSCNDAGRHGIVGDITGGSCIGEVACFQAGFFHTQLENGNIVGDITGSSCIGINACSAAGFEGGSVGGISESCRGNYACHFAAAGGGVVGDISNSCNIEYGCYELDRGSLDEPISNMDGCCNDSANQCQGFSTDVQILEQCQPVTETTENCDNGMDDTGNDLIDCADPTCADDDACAVAPPPETETCDNGMDDNGNGLIDCNDPDCYYETVCTNPMSELSFKLTDNQDGDDKLVVTVPSNRLGKGTVTVSVRDKDCKADSAPDGLTFNLDLIDEGPDSTETSVDLVVESGNLPKTDLPIIVDFNTLDFNRNRPFIDENGKEYWRSTFCVMAEHTDNVFRDSSDVPLPIAHTGSIVTLDYVVDPTFKSDFKIQGFSAIDADFDDTLGGNTPVKGYLCNSLGEDISADFKVSKNSFMNYCVEVDRLGFFVYDFRSVSFKNNKNSATYTAIDNHVKHVLVSRGGGIEYADPDGKIIMLTLRLPSFIFDGVTGGANGVPNIANIEASGIVELAPYQGPDSLNAQYVTAPDPSRRLLQDPEGRLLQESVARFTSIIQIDGSDATGGLSAGAYAGIAVGATVALLAIVLVVVRKKRGRATATASKEIEIPNHRPGAYHKNTRKVNATAERTNRPGTHPTRSNNRPGAYPKNTRGVTKTGERADSRPGAYNTSNRNPTSNHNRPAAYPKRAGSRPGAYPTSGNVYVDSGERA